MVQEVLDQMHKGLRKNGYYFMYAQRQKHKYTFLLLDLDCFLSLIKKSAMHKHGTLLNLIFSHELVDRCFCQKLFYTKYERKILSRRNGEREKLSISSY